MPEKAQFRRSNISIPKNKTELTNREIVRTRVGRSDNDRNMQNREREKRTEVTQTERPLNRMINMENKDTNMQKTRK